MWTFIKELFGFGLTSNEPVTPPVEVKVPAKAEPALKEVEQNIAEAIKAESKPAKKAKAAPKAKKKNAKK